MPARAHRVRDDRGVAKPSLVLLGVDLLKRAIPRHDARLELMITGRCNPFHEDPLKTIYMRVPIVDSRGDFNISTRAHDNVHYSALWNLASIANEHTRSCDMRRVIQSLRLLGQSSYQGDMRLVDVLLHIMPVTWRPPWPTDDGVPIEQEPYDENITYHEAITDAVIESLACEGILPDDAKNGLQRLIDSGNLNPRTLSSQEFLIHTDSRRRTVSRLLNCINALRERHEYREFNSGMTRLHAEGRLSGNLPVDALTGQRVGWNG